MRRQIILLALSLTLLAGCGDGGDSDAGQANGSAPAPAGSGSSSCEVQVGGQPKEKPTVTVPRCDPPTQLVSRDVLAGSGEPVTAGQTAVVQYVGVSWSNGQEFDASWDRGQPFPVENVGRAQVIQGWNEGLVGMRPGSRRLLVIPPDKGYGAQGTPDGAIRPNETLVFVVDLESVQG